MKTRALVKIAAMSAVLITAMAFSCQDHHIPDPVIHCERVDGSPRAFPCEFEIVKLEFLRGTTNQVVSTFLPGDTTVALPINASQAYFWLSMHSSVYLQYRVRVHVKRIAAASSQPVGGYELVYYRMAPIVPGYPPVYDDIISAPGAVQSAGNTLPLSPAKRPVNFDMPVGETRTAELLVTLGFDYEMLGGVYSGEMVIGVVNNTTALKLFGAPYNYNRGRDIQEARLSFVPEPTCEPNANCQTLSQGTWQGPDWPY